MIARGAPVPEGVILLGAGGHAKVVIEILRAAGETVAGLLDADSTPREVLSAPVIGDDGQLPQLYAAGHRRAFVALGANGLRRRLAGDLQSLGFELVNAISPAAKVSPSARLGRGVAIMPGAVVNAQAQIGDCAIINSGAVVEHDCRVGAGAHIGPGAVLAGSCQVGEEALVGAGACVIPDRKIGAGAVIGAGASVTRDVSDGLRVGGTPARPLSPSYGAKA